MRGCLRVKVSTSMSGDNKVPLQHVSKKLTQGTVASVFKEAPDIFLADGR